MPRTRASSPWMRHTRSAGPRPRTCWCFRPHEAGGMTAFRKAAGIAEGGGHFRLPARAVDVGHLRLRPAPGRAGHHPTSAWANQIMHQLLVEDLILAPDITPRRGRLGVWETPGLGFELNPDAVARAAETYQRDGASLQTFRSVMRWCARFGRLPGQPGCPIPLGVVQVRAGGGSNGFFSEKRLARDRERCSFRPSEQSSHRQCRYSAWARNNASTR